MIQENDFEGLVIKFARNSFSKFPLSSIMDKNKTTSDIEALLFRPSKVSWGVQTTIIKFNPRVERLVLLSIISSLVFAIVWAYFSQRAVVVDAMGEITPIASPIPMISKTGFTIKKISVKDNQTVLKDEIIIESTRSLIAEDKTRMEKVFSQLEDLFQKEESGSCDIDCLNSLKIISEDGLSFLDKIDQNTDFHREIVDLNKVLKDYYLQLKLEKTLPETLTSLNNEVRITKKRIHEIQIRKAQQILAIEYEELQNKLIGLQTQIREKEINTKSMLDSARTNYDISLGKISQSFKNYLENAIVRAPTTGRIRFANIKGVGQTIGGGETLFLITQASSDLWLKFSIAEVDLSKVKTGQLTRIDLSSYPASEFGIQKATIVEVLDKLPIENEQLKNPNFIGFAKLESQFVHFRNKKLPIRSGMMGKVKIIVKHESVLNIFMKKIFSIKDEYLGDFL